MSSWWKETNVSPSPTVRATNLSQGGCTGRELPGNRRVANGNYKYITRLYISIRRSEIWRSSHNWKLFHSLMTLNCSFMLIFMLSSTPLNTCRQAGLLANKSIYLSIAGIGTLQDRREMLTKKFFLDIRHPTSCLHHLLPTLISTNLYTNLKLRSSLTQ